MWERAVQMVRSIIEEREREREIERVDELDCYKESQDEHYLTATRIRSLLQTYQHGLQPFTIFCGDCFFFFFFLIVLCFIVVCALTFA